MPPKREPEVASSPSKIQRVQGQGIVVDFEQRDGSHSGTPQSRRSSFDNCFRTSSAQSHDSSFDWSKMSEYIKRALFDTTFDVPQGLIDEISKGNCIAFVGSGFTAPLIGDWNSLLKMLLEDAKTEIIDFNSKHSEGAAERDEQFNFLLEKADKLRGASSAEYDYFAQEIEDLVGEQSFQHLIQKRCKLDDNMEISNLMKTRLEAISKIPFRAIITTNYNNCFEGKPATLHGATDETHFEDILRPEIGIQEGEHSAASKADVLEALSCDDEDEFLAFRASTPKPLTDDSPDISDHPSVTSTQASRTQLSTPKDPSGMTLGEARAKFRLKCPVLKIHGCVNHPESIVLSRNAYKRLKHETPGYKMFLTTAMATSTMLYIGFSFTDDYLNDFRAEVLSMLRPRRSTQTSNHEPKVPKSSHAFRTPCKDQEEPPIGYAIIEGRSRHDCNFFRCYPYHHHHHHRCCCCRRCPQCCSSLHRTGATKAFKS
jgi:hypothetical protein